MIKFLSTFILIFTLTWDKSQSLTLEDGTTVNPSWYEVCKDYEKPVDNNCYGDLLGTSSNIIKIRVQETGMYWYRVRAKADKSRQYDSIFTEPVCIFDGVIQTNC